MLKKWAVSRSSHCDLQVTQTRAPHLKKMVRRNKKMLVIGPGIPILEPMLQCSNSGQGNYLPLPTIWRLFMLTAEQILAAHKANVETLFGLTNKAFEGVEKLVELNVQATKAALAETANHTQAVLAVKDAQELLALQASLVQPLAEK